VTHEILSDAYWRPSDDELTALLNRVYVDGGFTDRDVAMTVLAPGAVRARGMMLCARSIAGSLLGTLIVVPPSSKARLLAGPSEAELHLLAVDAACRGRGIGFDLVSAGIAEATRASYQGLVLWTQPTMHAAQRVYERAGFVRSIGEDFDRAGRTFRVYRRPL